MNKIILALTFLIVALVGAGAVAAAGDACNATADNLNNTVIDTPAVDTVNTTDAVAVENNSDDVNLPQADACENDSCSELKSIDGESNTMVQECSGAEEVNLDKMIDMTPIKTVTYKVAKKQSVVKVSSSMKVSKYTLESIKSLYGSHTLESIAMSIGLTPAQTKNIINQMKAGKCGSGYKKSLLKIDKSLKNTKNAKYIIK